MHPKHPVRDWLTATMRRRPLRLVAYAMTAAWTVLLAAPATRADWRDDIGYTQLAAELGADVPTGYGITVTQVEAGASGTGYFRPDTDQFAGTAFNFKTTTPTGVSGHATTVGTYLYGPSGIAPGCGTGGAAINIWEANDWLNRGIRATENADVANFSWIGTTGSASVDTQITRRLDYSINRDDYVAVVAVNNGGGSALPNLLCQSYNAITVGVSSGNHSHGYTTIDGAGRMKPDIVAPAAYTSYAAPMVGSAAALLLQTAKTTPGYANAVHSESVKAILMAGATKTGLAGWSHTQTQPLDGTYGAGQLNVYRSHQILIGGEQEAGTSHLVAGRGWDFDRTAGAGGAKLYFFDVPENSVLDEFSAVLTWNCLVNSATLATTLANLDLQLWTASEFSTLSLVDQSISTVDNVELLSLHDLAAGRYAISVISDASNTDYALAWYSGSLGPAPNEVPEPGSLQLLLAGMVLGLIVFSRRARK